MVSISARHGVKLDRSEAARLWERIVEDARTPEALAKGRDVSSEKHREEWVAIYSLADSVLPGFGEILYDDFELDPTSWIPFPDTIPVLRAVHGQGIPIGIVSDAGWDIRRIFEVHGVSQIIDAYVLSYEHGITKPDPALFKTACSLLRVEPERSIMVGDHYLTDGGAIAAGLTAYILPAARLGMPRGLSPILELLGVRQNDATSLRSTDP